MKIEVSRFGKDGRLKVIVRHEANSFFWPTDLTECPRFEDEKLRVEVLHMVDWWNKGHHEEFELTWKSMSEKKVKK